MADVAGLGNRQISLRVNYFNGSRQLLVAFRNSIVIRSSHLLSRFGVQFEFCTSPDVLGARGAQPKTYAVS